MAILKHWPTTFYLINRKSKPETPNDCKLEYIPHRLKRNRRPIIQTYQIGEHLFYRCKPEELENPYKKISIAELSHNRSGFPLDSLSTAADVLYNINPNNTFERYTNLEICILEIKSLTPQNIYRKQFSETKADVIYNAIIELRHDPGDCMYPHSVFRVSFNGEIVTYDNYQKTLGKHPKIRNSIKEEIASMIKRRQVSQNEQPIL
ncbi:hypothetical protein BH10BAC4_BH10BAC4_19790 [soil metagenome]